MIKSLNELKRNVHGKPVKLVVAAANDSNTLEAVFNAAKTLNISYILVGDRERILLESSKLEYSPDFDTVVHCSDDATCARTAVALIKEGSGDALMKGSIETAALLKAVLDKKTGIREAGVLSHLAILETPAYHKLIGITDGGMIPYPTLPQKADIVKNAAGLFRSIGYGNPKIAALCASETVSPKMQETVDAAELQAMCGRGELSDCTLEGPLSFDIAVNRESAAVKGFSCAISGETDILLVPDITAGNILAKGLIFWAGAKMAGCILGAKTPIVLTSRGATTEEKLLSIMLSVVSPERN